MSKRKRNDLTLADRYEVVKLLDQKLTQTKISKRLGCSISQICHINSKKDDIRTQYQSNSNPDRKRQRSGKASNMEAALTTWFIDARARDIPISGPILEEKAKDLAQALQQPDFNATSGWLSRWKTRNNIVYKRLHGEKKDSDFTGADHWVTNVLPNLLETYQPQDIYNADETGLYYRTLPDGTLTQKTEQLCGGKKAKDRITVMVTCNMTGTDRRCLLVIGKSRNPRCFRGVKNLPVTYRTNKNAWMNGDIFSKWLQDFNKDMRRQRQQKLHLVDNCNL